MIQVDFFFLMILSEYFRTSDEKYFLLIHNSFNYDSVYPNKTIFDLMFTFFGLKGKQLFLHANMQVCVCFSTKRLRNKVCYQIIWKNTGAMNA